MSEPYYRQHWIEIEPERRLAYDQLLAFHPAMEPLLAPLELKPGLRVLDVGSGPGYTAMELVRRVSPYGRVVGIDINARFVGHSANRARARRLAADFVQAAFPPLPLRSASFDRVFCRNVLEYVESPADAAAEMARVTVAGGIVVAVSADWDMIVLETTPQERERNERVIAAAKSIAVHEPRIGRKLYGLLKGAGLDKVAVEVRSGVDTGGRTLPALRASFARYARDSGRIAEQETRAWLSAIERAIERGQFLFMLPQFVAYGVKK